MKKDFKDYSIVKYFAKLQKVDKKDITKDVITISFPYGDTDLLMNIYFKNQRSTAVECLLSLVYDEYGKGKFASEAEFMRAFTAKYSFFEDRVHKDSHFLYSPINQNRVDNTASQAFTNIIVLISCLNEFLGRDEENISEEDIRGLHQEYLSSRVKSSKTFTGLGIGAVILGIVLLIVTKGGSTMEGLAVLGFLAIPVGLVMSIFFVLRRKFYEGQLKKARNNRR